MGNDEIVSGATRELERLRALSDVTRAFAEVTTDYRQLLDVVVRRTAEVIGAFCALGLVAEDGRWLLPSAAFDRDADALALLRRI